MDMDGVAARLARRWLDASEAERAAVNPAMRDAYRDAAIEYLQHEVRQLRERLERRAAAAPAEARSQAAHGVGRPKADDILRVVARRYGLVVADIIGRRRQRRIVQARQVAMWLMVRAGALTLQEAAAETGRRDHTTVMYGVRVVDRTPELLRTARGLAEACGWPVMEDGVDADQ